MFLFHEKLAPPFAAVRLCGNSPLLAPFGWWEKGPGIDSRRWSFALSRPLLSAIVQASDPDVSQRSNCPQTTKNNLAPQPNHNPAQVTQENVEFRRRMGLKKKKNLWRKGCGREAAVARMSVNQRGHTLCVASGWPWAPLSDFDWARKSYASNRRGLSTGPRRCVLGKAWLRDRLALSRSLNYQQHRVFTPTLKGAGSSRDSTAGPAISNLTSYH